MPNERPIVVDGANVAYVEQTQDGKPKMSNLVAVREALEQKGYDPIIIVDASLIHEIDDPDQLQAFLDSQRIHQAPADTEADYFVLETAAEKNAKVVSNDRFEEFLQRFDWIENRRVPLMIVNGEVELYEPTLDNQNG